MNVSTVKLLVAGAAGALLAMGLRAMQRAEATRIEKMPAAKPEPLQRWEGEGGAVPVSAHQTAQQVEPHVSGAPEVDDPLPRNLP